MVETTHFDPLEQQERLRRPFLVALFLHVSLFAFSLSYSWLVAHNLLRIGDPNARPGGSVGINVVKNIPLAPAQTVIENPVANDTRSSIPSPPTEAAKPQPKVEAEQDAMPLPSKQTKKAAERRPPPRKFHAYVPERDNQLFSSKGMGVNTASYSGLQPDSMGVGIGSGAGSPFGAYYGWYAEALQRRIGEQWQRELMQLDRNISNPPLTVVSFEIQRDGSLRNIKLVQSSRNSAVDYAALRAVTNSNPVTPLPPGLAKSYLSTEVRFQVKR